MNISKLIWLFTFYDRYIAEKFPVPLAVELPDELYDEREIRDDHLLAHLRWMCQEGIKMAMHGGGDKLVKAHAWRGYIQGELRALGIFTINQLREHVRSKEGEDAAETT